MSTSALLTGLAGVGILALAVIEKNRAALAAGIAAVWVAKDLRGNR